MTICCHDWHFRFARAGEWPLRRSSSPIAVKADIEFLRPARPRACMGRVQMAISSRTRTFRSLSVSIGELERMWRLDSPTGLTPPRTRLLIRRVSPDDVRAGAIAVSVDDRPVQSQLRYGESVTVAITAGAHLVTITNSWFVRHLLADVMPGRALVVECGIGTQSRLWSALLPQRLRALNVWIAVQPEAPG
jgi:hypothetical protein